MTHRRSVLLDTPCNSGRRSAGPPRTAPRNSDPAPADVFPRLRVGL